MARALGWWRKAAAHGHAKAQCCLGVAYWEGTGVTGDGKPDRKTALGWFRLAASQGDVQAQNSMGYACFAGEGTPGGRVDYAAA